MQAAVAVLFIGLLLCAWPASAQQEKEYSLTVAIHKDLYPPLPRGEIEYYLRKASDLMSFNNCPVKFTLKDLWTFDTTPRNIANAFDLEAAHSVPADIKVVQTVDFCKNRYDQSFVGCAWRPSFLQKTVIVEHRPIAHTYILWVHEFGHTTGLEHRIDDHLALMTPCGLKGFNRKISPEECQCFLAGPGGCQMADLDLQCPVQ